MEDTTEETSGTGTGGLAAAVPAKPYQTHTTSMTLILKVVGDVIPEVNERRVVTPEREESKTHPHWAETSHLRYIFEKKEVRVDAISQNGNHGQRKRHRG
jgi:hypothetical protein